MNASDLVALPHYIPVDNPATLQNDPQQINELDLFWLNVNGEPSKSL
jgi:hypothetical protein